MRKTITAGVLGMALLLGGQAQAKWHLDTCQGADGNEPFMVCRTMAFASPEKDFKNQSDCDAAGEAWRHGWNTWYGKLFYFFVSKNSAYSCFPDGESIMPGSVVDTFH